MATPEAPDSGGKHKAFREMQTDERTLLRILGHITDGEPRSIRKQDVDRSVRRDLVGRVILGGNVLIGENLVESGVDDNGQITYTGHLHDSTARLYRYMRRVNAARASGVEDPRTGFRQLGESASEETP